MATQTFQELQIDNLVTFTLAPIANNFKTIDSFIKNFTNFQRKFNEFQKIQKATAQDLSNFKTSTTNHFSTLNQVLDSRGSVSKGNNKQLEEDITDMKKQLKELKLFVTENTRQLNNHMEDKQKETAQIYKKYDAKLSQIDTHHQSSALRVESLQNEIVQVKIKYTSKTESESLKAGFGQIKGQMADTRNQLERITSMLQNLGVEEFKITIDKMDKQLRDDMASVKVKFKLKTDLSDTLKLQDMMLNMLNFSYQNVAKKYASKAETKKALIYLQKKVNSLIQMAMPEQEGDRDRDGALIGKGWKCISCARDLGQLENNKGSDKYKVWSVFPAKEQSFRESKEKDKDKYSGFGNGFQTIMQSVVSKKGGQIGYDEKGRMTTPFNLTREVQPPLLKHSNSQSKTNQGKNSPVKQQPSQSNYMNLFGRSNEVDLDLRSQYLQKQRGLMSVIKNSFQQKQKK